MSTNFTTTRTNRQPQITPEIGDALKTARHAEFRLEAEYFAFDWSARLELAEELRAVLNELPDELADITARVAEDLDSEGEDFSEWETRSDAAARMRRVVRALSGEQQHPADGPTICAAEVEVIEDDDEPDAEENEDEYLAHLFDVQMMRDQEVAF